MSDDEAGSADMDKHKDQDHEDQDRKDQNMGNCRGNENAGITDSVWDVDGAEVRIVTAVRTDGESAQVQALMSLLECSEAEAEHVLRIIREDGEFITSVHADIDAL